MRALLVVMLVLAPSARAWDSSCSKFTNKSLEPGVLQGQTGVA